MIELAAAQIRGNPMRMQKNKHRLGDILSIDAWIRTTALTRCPPMIWNFVSNSLFVMTEKEASMMARKLHGKAPL